MSSSTISTGTFKMAGLPWFAMVCGVALLLGFAMADVPYIVGLEDGTGWAIQPHQAEEQAYLSHVMALNLYIYIYTII